MTLPKSLGDPTASAEQLRDESKAIENPFGVMTMQIHPALYEAVAHDKEVLTATLRSDIKQFLSKTANGDAAREAEMIAIVFKENDEFRKGYIPFRTWMSASNKDYADAHALSVQQEKGSPALAGVIIMPRAEMPFGLSAQNATGVSSSQFAAPAVPLAQMNFMTIWHEFAHTTGADEAQADKMAAAVTRKAFGVTPLQVYADLRAIDSLLSFDSQPQQWTDPGNPDKKIDIPARHQIYGWRTVEAVDEIINMPEGKLKSLDEKTIAGFAKTDIEQSRHAALVRVGSALKAENPGLIVNPTKENPDATSNIHDIGEALNKLLKNGSFDADPEAQAVAKRSLLAVSRLALDAPKIDVDLGVTKSRFIKTGIEEIPAPAQQQTLKAPAR